MEDGQPVNALSGDIRPGKDDAGYSAAAALSIFLPVARS
jgi:hypothetical protein